MRTPITRRRALRSHTKGQLVDAVTLSERDLAITTAWANMRRRRAFLLGLLAGSVILAAVHALVCP
jgi:hypothetical protein